MAADRAERLLKIKRGELIAVESLKSLVIERAHSTRDLLLYGAHRHVGMLAAAHRVDPAVLLSTFNTIMRATLTRIAKEGPKALRGNGLT